MHPCRCNKDILWYRFGYIGSWELHPKKISTPKFMFMSSILINGISAKSGGGKSILINFLKLLHESTGKGEFIVIVPAGSDYSVYSKEDIRIIPVKNSNFFLFIFYFFTIKQIIRKYRVSLILNIADVIVPVSTNQIYLFDWPYATYPESVAWNRLTRKDWLFKKFKLFLIKRYINLPVLLIAQTEVSRKRLKQRFSIRNAEVVPNAVSLDNLTGGEHKDFDLPKERFKLLYLTKYYSHKNIEIFLSLARLIGEEKMPYNIIITINESQHINAKRILEALKNENLDKIVINVGPVKMEHVPSLYQQCDALLMPTLLESFSGTYVEAMYHGKPIFTSDLDFAKDICGDAAFYFDPLEAVSIKNSIKLAYENPDLILSKIKLGKDRLNTLLSWEQAFEKLLGLMEKYQMKD